MLNFLSNLGAYEHNLLAYEHDIRGCKFAPGVNLRPDANLHPVANCAHEHGLRWTIFCGSTAWFVPTWYSGRKS